MFSPEASLTDGALGYMDVCAALGLPADTPPAPVAFALAAVSLGLSMRATGNQAWGRVRWLAGTAGALCFVASLTSTGLFLDYLP